MRIPIFGAVILLLVILLIGYVFLATRTDNFYIVDGNVGIGTDKPDSQLHIRGRLPTHPSEGIRMGKDSGSDNYQLEIRAIGGMPHIDLGMEDVDFNMRIALTGPKDLTIYGGNLGIETLQGSGDAYVCVTSAGVFYRSKSPCLMPQSKK